MSAVLEIPSLRARVSPVTVAQYHRLPEFNANGRRTELIRGIVIEKIPKSPLHGTIASRLFQIILPQLPGGTCARKEEALTLRDSEPEPDIAVLTGKRGDYLESHPSTALLAVEVAVSSYAEDQLKGFLYAEAEVPEYWIVLPNARSLEVYRRPQGGRYTEMRLHSAEETVSSASVPGVQVSLAELFAGVTSVE